MHHHHTRGTITTIITMETEVGTTTTIKTVIITIINTKTVIYPVGQLKVAI